MSNNENNLDDKQSEFRTIFVMSPFQIVSKTDK